jgi:hypothetical protein
MTLSWLTVSILARRIQFTDEDSAPSYFISVEGGSDGEIYSESYLSAGLMRHVGTDELTLCVDLVIRGLYRATLSHFPMFNTIPGARVGETDGIDINTGYNYWVHDVEVTN